MSYFASARMNMVDGQIRPNRVTDPGVIDAFRDVPRELFVPGEAQCIAYVDHEIAVAPGRWLLEPLVHSRLLQEAHITSQDVVLDVGCATGYSTALLARLAASVIALESDPALFDRSAQTLTKESFPSVTLVKGPLTAGYPDRGPYSVILINGAVAEVPATLLDQLADGGRLLAVVANPHPLARLGQARLYRRIGCTISSVALFETSAPILPGFEAKPRFVF